MGGIDPSKCRPIHTKLSCRLVHNRGYRCRHLILSRSSLRTSGCGVGKDRDIAESHCCGRINYRDMLCRRRCTVTPGGAAVADYYKVYCGDGSVGPNASFHPALHTRSTHS